MIRELKKHYHWKFSFFYRIPNSSSKYGHTLSGNSCQDKVVELVQLLQDEKNAYSLGSIVVVQGTFVVMVIGNIVEFFWRRKILPLLLGELFNTGICIEGAAVVLQLFAFKWKNIVDNGVIFDDNNLTIDYVIIDVDLIMDDGHKRTRRLSLHPSTPRWCCDGPFPTCAGS